MSYPKNFLSYVLKTKLDRQKTSQEIYPHPGWMMARVSILDRPSKLGLVETPESPWVGTEGSDDPAFLLGDL